MRILVYTFLTINLLFLFSCFGPNQTNPEVLKAEQVEYEKQKAALISLKGGIYREHKQSILDKIEYVSLAIATSDTMTSVFNDSLYTHPDPIEIIKLSGTYDQKNDGEKERFFALVIDKDTTFKNASNLEAVAILNVIQSCQTNGVDNSCILMDSARMNNFYTLDYLFVHDDVYRIDPEMNSSVDFIPGHLFRKVTCFDLKEKRPFYQFFYEGTNNSQIIVGHLGDSNDNFRTFAKLERDLMSEAINEGQRKLETHFLVKNNYLE